MHEDEPSDEVHDIFTEAIFGEHPLGRLISGTEESITPMTRNQINGFYRRRDRKSTRLNSSHPSISYAVFCLKKKKKQKIASQRYKQNKNTPDRSKNHTSIATEDGIHSTMCTENLQ